MCRRVARGTCAARQAATNLDTRTRPQEAPDQKLIVLLARKQLQPGGGIAKRAGNEYAVAAPRPAAQQRFTWRHGSGDMNGSDDARPARGIATNKRYAEFIRRLEQAARKVGKPRLVLRR